MIECPGCGQMFDPIRNSRRLTYCSRPCRYAYDRTQIPARFWARVDKTGDCWLWTGGDRGDGYGSFAHHRKAHRVAYELTNGSIPKGVVIRHICDTPRCVRPDHLVAGTQAENMRDASERRRWPTTKTWSSRRSRAAAALTCPAGHERTEANTYRIGTYMRCRTCAAESARKRREAITGKPRSRGLATVTVEVR